jgi:uncharacterized lipoprotein
MHPRFAAAAALAAAALVAACSTTNELLHGKQVEYKSAQTLPSLEVPPDLTAPTGDNRYAVPGQATASGYQSERAQRQAASGNAVLPAVPNMHIARDGNERWLVVANETPTQLWPLLKDFWQENGFLIKLDEPQIGVMETDWAENRAKLEGDIDRFTLTRLLGPLYSTGERDKFRTRLEHTPDGKGTEIYISHYGLKQVYSDSEKVTTAWEPRAPDPGLEAIFLRRLMVRLGAKNEAAAAPRRSMCSNPSTAPGAASASRSTGSVSRSRTATGTRACTTCATPTPRARRKRRRACSRGSPSGAATRRRSSPSSIAWWSRTPRTTASSKSRTRPARPSTRRPRTASSRC